MRLSHIGGVIFAVVLEKRAEGTEIRADQLVNGATFLDSRADLAKQRVQQPGRPRSAAWATKPPPRLKSDTARMAGRDFSSKTCVKNSVQVGR